ncbi:hypothetical protein ACIOKD_14800 [Streptomyces sp. NPDC087844]|uniref:hypothetical protein n=1 Tax=Streptomyces sp. NPDC087844 TaxID=3365805 RepID=UPI0037FBA214
MGKLDGGGSVTTPGATGVDQIQVRFQSRSRSRSRSELIDQMRAFGADVGPLL